MSGDVGTYAPGAVVFGKYEVVRCLKIGGMGAVYEVTHLDTRRRRALKVMLPSLVADRDLRARFRMEATITADLETEHVVETFDAGVDPETGVPFIVMELLRGDDLASLLERDGRLAAENVATLLAQTAVALAKTHAAGIVHRDLKPENLFLTRRDDGTPRIKVLDFGIAKMFAQGTLSKGTRAVGSPLYMAPEQAHGEARIGPAADTYAVGQLAFTLLVGHAYWDEEAASDHGLWALLMKVIAGPKEPASARAARRGVSLPPGFDAWFARSTAPDPAARFEAVTEQVRHLAQVLGLDAKALPALGILASSPAVARGARGVASGPSSPGRPPASAPDVADTHLALDPLVARPSTPSESSVAALRDRRAGAVPRSAKPILLLAAGGVAAGVLAWWRFPDAPLPPQPAVVTDSVGASHASASVARPSSAPVERPVVEPVVTAAPSTSAAAVPSVSASVPSLAPRPRAAASPPPMRTARPKHDDGI